MNASVQQLRRVRKPASTLVYLPRDPRFRLYGHPDDVDAYYARLLASPLARGVLAAQEPPTLAASDEFDALFDPLHRATVYARDWLLADPFRNLVHHAAACGYTVELVEGPAPTTGKGPLLTLYVTGETG